VPLDFEASFGYTLCGLSFSLNSSFRHGALEQSERGRSFCAPLTDRTRVSYVSEILSR
jgi:hypothetical protein